MTKFDDDILRAVAVEIRMRRVQLSLSQEDLAAACGLHRTYISDIERGARNPSLLTLRRIAAALNTSVSGLIRAAEEALAPVSL